MKFAILAPGRIAHMMAKAVSGLPEVEKYAIGSRDLGRAKEFADQWGFEKAYGSYEELVQDDAIDLIYIATPHSHHFETAKLCIEHGKNILVEKPFTVNAKQAKELIALAKEKGVFMTEAIWTRYMPSRKMIDELIEKGTIGKVTSLMANLCYELMDKERMTEPELAGGALLDLGVYPINFARMVFKKEVEDFSSHAVMSPKGVDYINSMTLVFEGGEMAVLHSSMLVESNRMGAIYGETGYIEVQNINNCEEIRVYDANHQLTQTIPVPEQINGYEYEVIACMKAIEEGKLECEEMPHAETIWVMELMDAIRKEWGLVYPCE